MATAARFAVSRVRSTRAAFGDARAAMARAWTLADPARGAFRARVVVVVSRRRDDRLAIAETATLAFARHRATSVALRARGASLTGPS